MTENSGQQRAFVLLLFGLAVLLRAGAIWWEPNHFWSYTAYYDLASVVAHGGGYCMSPDGKLCAYFPPVYPTILAACVLTGHARGAMILAGSLIGAGMVLLTFFIGRRLFGPFAGLLAASYAAAYPYYVWHDAVIQETATLALVVAGAILLLIRINHTASKWSCVCAGAMLALTVLTKANLFLFLPFAVGWVAFFSPGSPALRLKRALWVTTGVVLLLGPWVVRTWRITGAPILYSNGGFSLWTSNHRLTFDYFPKQSIDAAAGPEFDDLTPAEKRELLAIDDPQGIQETRWFWNKGMAFIEANPGLTFRRAIYKMWIAFSPRFSPAKSWTFQLVYFFSYVPILVLSMAGAWRARRQWRDLGYIYLLIFSFALGRAVFWGHTGHRMYIDLYLMVLSAHALGGFTERAPGI